MPLVRIDLLKGKSAEYRRAVGDTIYEAMTRTINVPKNDQFQVISEHSPENLIINPVYMDIQRTPDAMIIQITMRKGRTVDQKKALYQAIADGLNAKLGVRREDVMINIVEDTPEDWSFGNGVAQYA